MLYKKKNNKPIISFENTYLIEEIKLDIEEFGKDKEVYAFIKKFPDGQEVLTNYDFIVEDDPIKETELKQGEVLEVWTLQKVLQKLEKQSKSF